MKKSTFIGLILSVLTFAGWSQSSTVYFEKNSYALTISAQVQLDSLIQKIKISKNRKELKLIGHTDADASNSYNDKLALNRALEVKAYLDSNKVYNRCHVFTRGETQTVNANANEAQKALNRRVIIELNYVSDNTVYKDLLQKYQEFEVLSDQDTVIKCKQGTEIVIKAGSFNTGPKAGSIKIKVKEFYGKHSFIASNITASTYDNKILESRGMLNVRVSRKGKPVRLNKGKTIDILFKDREVGDGTQLFTGKRINGEVLWIQANNRDRVAIKTSFSGSSATTIGGEVIEQVTWYETRDAGVRRTITKTKKGIVITLDTVYRESENELRSNLMTVSKLGWINCDRFYTNPAEKIDYVVSVPGDMDADVTLVFEDINSVMPYTYRQGNDYIFSNIPIGMKIKVIGLYKNEKQKQYYLASKTSVIQEGKTHLLVLKKGSKAEVKNMIAGL